MEDLGRTELERQCQVITGGTLFSRHLGATDVDCMPVWTKQRPGCSAYITGQERQRKMQIPFKFLKQKSDSALLMRSEDKPSCIEVRWEFGEG